MPGAEIQLLWSSDDARKRHLISPVATRFGRGIATVAARSTIARPLSSFTLFFLRTRIDQVDFMEALIEPERLRKRIEIWAEEEIRLGNINSKVGAVISAILY